MGVVLYAEFHVRHNHFGFYNLIIIIFKVYYQVAVSRILNLP